MVIHFLMKFHNSKLSTIYMRKEWRYMNNNEPLAFRMRPRTLEEYVGQEHVLGKGKILYRTIKADRLSSIILFGPPGCGKHH